MGCNGHNHPPGCDCGWGGDTGGSGGFSGIYKELFTNAPAPSHQISPPASPRIASDGRWHAVGNGGPNAKCPVCGQAVYFVRTENGGRVFFDELGPPWPKHPCTDNGTSVVYAPEGYAQHYERQVGVSDWHLVVSAKTRWEDGVMYLEGYCPGLGEYFRLSNYSDPRAVIRPPFLVKREKETGTYRFSYLVEAVGAGLVAAPTEMLYPTGSGLGIDVWKRAFEGDGEAANDIGWRHSFFWDNVDGGEKYRKLAVAEYWFSRSAQSGNPAGQNNLAVLMLKRADGDPETLEKAWKALMASAFQMMPTAYGHMGRMLESGFDEFDSKLVGALLGAIGRHLTFAENAEQEDQSDAVDAEGSGGAVRPENGIRYSPNEIERYFHVETARNIARLEDYLPAWNLFWLSAENLDGNVQDMERYYLSLKIPGPLIDTIAFDLDEEIAEGVTLKDALRMHPRRFLHYFESADTDWLSVSKKNPSWRESVILKAQEAAARIPETGGLAPADVLPLLQAKRKNLAD